MGCGSSVPSVHEPDERLKCRVVPAPPHRRRSKPQRATGKVDTAAAAMLPLLSCRDVSWSFIYSSKASDHASDLAALLSCTTSGLTSTRVPRHRSLLNGQPCLGEISLNLQHDATRLKLASKLSCNVVATATMMYRQRRKIKNTTPTSLASRDSRTHRRGARQRSGVDTSVPNIALISSESTRAVAVASLISAIVVVAPDEPTPAAVLYIGWREEATNENVTQSLCVAICKDALGDFWTSQFVDVDGFAKGASEVSPLLLSWLQSDGVTDVDASYFISVRRRRPFPSKVAVDLWAELDDPCATASRVDELLLSDQNAVNERDVFGRTALHIAAASGRVDLVRAVLRSRRTALTTRDSQGRTPLFVAVWARHPGVVRYLLQFINRWCDPSDAWPAALFSRDLSHGERPIDHAVRRQLRAKEHHLRSYREWAEIVQALNAMTSNLLGSPVPCRQPPPVIDDASLCLFPELPPPIAEVLRGDLVLLEHSLELSWVHPLSGRSVFHYVFDSQRTLRCLPALITVPGSDVSLLLCAEDVTGVLPVELCMAPRLGLADRDIIGLLKLIDKRVFLVPARPCAVSSTPRRLAKHASSSDRPVALRSLRCAALMGRTVVVMWILEQCCTELDAAAQDIVVEALHYSAGDAAIRVALELLNKTPQEKSHLRQRLCTCIDRIIRNAVRRARSVREATSLLCSFIMEQNASKHVIRSAFLGEANFSFVTMVTRAPSPPQSTGPPPPSRARHRGMRQSPPLQQKESAAPPIPLWLEMLQRFPGDTEAAKHIMEFMHIFAGDSNAVFTLAEVASVGVSLLRTLCLGLDPVARGAVTACITRASPEVLRAVLWSLENILKHVPLQSIRVFAAPVRRSWSSAARAVSAEPALLATLDRVLATVVSRLAPTHHVDERWVRWGCITGCALFIEAVLVDEVLGSTPRIVAAVIDSTVPSGPVFPKLANVPSAVWSASAINVALASHELADCDTLCHVLQMRSVNNGDEIDASLLGHYLNRCLSVLRSGADAPPMPCLLEPAFTVSKATRDSFIRFAIATRDVASVERFRSLGDVWEATFVRSVVKTDSLWLLRSYVTPSGAALHRANRLVPGGLLVAACLSRSKHCVSALCEVLRTIVAGGANIGDFFDRCSVTEACCMSRFEWGLRCVGELCRARNGSVDDALRQMLSYSSVENRDALVQGLAPVVLHASCVGITVQLSKVLPWFAAVAPPSLLLTLFCWIAGYASKAEIVSMWLSSVISPIRDCSPRNMWNDTLDLALTRSSAGAGMPDVLSHLLRAGANPCRLVPTELVVSTVSMTLLGASLSSDGLPTDVSALDCTTALHAAIIRDRPAVLDALLKVFVVGSPRIGCRPTPPPRDALQQWRYYRTDRGFDEPLAASTAVGQPLDLARVLGRSACVSLLLDVADGLLTDPNKTLL